LRRGEELLWDMATDMEPEHGRLWIYDTDDQQTVAFTPDGMEYPAGDAPGVQTQAIISAVLSGRLPVIFSFLNCIGDHTRPYPSWSSDWSTRFPVSLGLRYVSESCADDLAPIDRLIDPTR